MGCNTSKIDPSVPHNYHNGVGDKRVSCRTSAQNGKTSIKGRNSVPELRIPNHDESKHINAALTGLTEVTQETVVSPAGQGNTIQVRYLCFGWF